MASALESTAVILTVCMPSSRSRLAWNSVPVRIQTAFDAENVEDTDAASTETLNWPHVGQTVPSARRHQHVVKRKRVLLTNFNC